MAAVMVVLAHSGGELTLCYTITALLWCAVSGFWAIGHAFIYRSLRLTLTLRQCLCLVLWLSIGCALCRVGFTPARRAHFVATSKRWVDKLGPETGETVSRLSLIPDDVSAGMPSTPETILEQIDHVDEAAHSLVLTSSYAQQMRVQQTKRWQVSRRIVAAWCTLEMLTHSRDQNLPTVEFEKVRLELQQVLDDVVASPLYPLQEEQPQSEVVRLATFDLLRWPGLSAQQLAAVQEWEAKQPYVARLLLVDYTVINARQSLAEKWPNAGVTEEDAVTQLRRIDMIDALLGEPTP